MVIILVLSSTLPNLLAARPTHVLILYNAMHYFSATPVVDPQN